MTYVRPAIRRVYAYAGSGRESGNDWKIDLLALPLRLDHTPHINIPQGSLQ